MHYHVTAWVWRTDAAGEYWSRLGETITRYLPSAQNMADAYNAKPQSFRAEVSRACNCRHGEQDLSGCLCTITAR